MRFVSVNDYYTHKCLVMYQQSDSTMSVAQANNPFVFFFGSVEHVDTRFFIISMFAVIHIFSHFIYFLYTDFPNSHRTQNET